MTLLAHLITSALALAGQPPHPAPVGSLWPRVGDPASRVAVQLSAPARAAKERARPPTAEVEAANRAALQEPRTDAFVDSVQVYSWTEGGIYRLYTAPGRITDIALEPGEALTAVAAGDTVRWIVGDTTSGSGPSRQVHILLKPSAAGLSTNLVITTDRRIYRLQAEATQRTAMAAVSWTYPRNALLAVSHAAEDRVGSGDGTAAAADLFHFGYVLEGDKPSWRPLRVFDDGRRVFIQFPAALAQDQAPPLFARGPDGKSELLNYRVQGRFYVVDHLFQAAELRLGGRKQQVVRIERRAGRAR